MRIHHFALKVALMGVLVPSAVFGVDGVILIDQNKALTGNVTPGDTPGFPVTITQPGSYRLDSNLTVPNVNTTAIIIAADNVTIDLNGFSLLGPNVCGQAGFPIFDCAPGGNTAVGSGITTATANHNNIAIRNGTIQGMGSDGIFLGGYSFRVERIHATSNGRHGMVIASGVVEDNVAVSNQFNGIVAILCVVSHNAAISNGGAGIVASESLVVQNVTTDNFEGGLDAGDGVSYIGNVFNERFAIPVSSGTNLGQNLCNGAVCP